MLTTATGSKNVRLREQFEQEQKAFNQAGDLEEESASKKSKSVKPIIMYRPGQNQLDLYKPGKSVRIFIPAKYLLSENNVKDRKIFGTDIYSDNSDIILACQHVGLLQDLPLSNCKGILVTVLIEKPPRKYEASFRNNVRSRAWTNISDTDSNAFKIQDVKVIADETSFLTKQTPVDKSNFSYGIEQHRFLSNVTIVFGLTCDPAVKYTINSVSDRGYNNGDLTSARLKNDEILILETENSKHELKYDKTTKKYVWSTISEDKGTLVSEPKISDLDWQEIKWGHESVIVRDNEYKLTLTFFQKQ
ncbi:hypothetical protein FDP41_000627 [Naegleria fowleri]|uniref:Uncharacterized protein n=1 Tax=Naegleria fowleri TaxID=5763 RepID=A0A6A5CHI6_NAEFO|nr:uncharacterized protein FDP41_000627 [Naegleria fowleri]KAF0984728.1 hypothetical protein FDP41_000627 [Naegleria fowleri]CAG4716758.1 unnamed protein product [Naegleria fowleri]